MQKWEYGILTRSDVVMETKFSSVRGQFEAKFNENIIAIAEYDTKKVSNKVLKELEARCLLLAFNKLGSLGWELCTDTLVCYLQYHSADSATREERFIFRRPLE